MSTKSPVDIKIYRQRELEGRENAEMVTCCAFCPEWQFLGTAAQGREAARKHRQRKHPEIKDMIGRMRGKKVAGWRSQRFITTDREEVEEERRKRMYLLGIEP